MILVMKLLNVLTVAKDLTTIYQKVSAYLVVVLVIAFSAVVLAKIYAVFAVMAII